MLIFYLIIVTAVCAATVPELDRSATFNRVMFSLIAIFGFLFCLHPTSKFTPLFVAVAATFFVFFNLTLKVKDSFDKLLLSIVTIFAIWGVIIVDKFF